MLARQHVLGFVVLLSFAFSWACMAQTTAFWVDPVSGDWTDPTRWSTNPVFPDNTGAGTFDAVIDQTGAPYTITNTADIDLHQLRLDSSDATLSLPAGTLTTDLQLTAGRIAVSGGQLLGGGTLSGGRIDVAAGLATVWGVVDGPMQFIQTGGESRALVSASAGTFYVSGGTLVLQQSPLLLGTSGQFTLTQTGGYIRQASLLARLGTTFPQGSAGQIDMLLDGASTLYDAADPNSSTILGDGTQSSATVTVRNGARADFAATSIGQGTGSATLTVDGGATVTFRSLIIGPNDTSFAVPRPGGNGTLSINGSASRVYIGYPSGGSSNVGAGSTFGGSGNIIINDGRLDVFGNLFVRDNGSVQYNGGTFNGGALRPIGGRVLLSTGNDKVLRCAVLAISGPGLVDLSDNFAHIDYFPGGGSPIVSIRAFLATGYAGGAWTGNGLTSSAAAANPGHALAYAEASALTAIPSIFGTVDASSILIRYSRYGDADLNGTVNLADFNRLAAHFGSTDAFWSEGDFNYDGVVNLQDFNRLAANFGLSAAGPEVTSQDWAALAAVVPEPSLLFIAAPTLALRRRLRLTSSPVHNNRPAPRV
jgi:hypothetical protein